MISSGIIYYFFKFYQKFNCSIFKNRLLEKLENESRENPEEMKEILELFYSRLVSLFDCWKKPNPNSKKDVESGSLTVEGRKFKLKMSSQQKKFVLMLSSLLNIDEVESVMLLTAFIEHDPLGKSFSCEDEADWDYFREKLFEFFFEERAALLNSICTIFKHGKNMLENQMFEIWFIYFKI